MPVLADVVRELERLKHDRAVWMEIVEFLGKFIDQEVKQAEHAIIAQGCVTHKVPQSVIREFIESINEESIEPLNNQIEMLEGLNVEEANDDDPKEESTRKKKGKKTNSGPKVGSARKKIRPVVQKPGPKAQNAG